MRLAPVNAALAVMLLLLSSPATLRAETIVLDGSLDTTVRISKEMRWRVDQPLGELKVRLALPADFSNRAVSQQVRNLRVELDPNPARVEDERDGAGNTWKTITWQNLRRDAQARISFEARVTAGLSAMESIEPFPVKHAASGQAAYLRPTQFVQSDSPEVQALSRQLTRKASAQHEAVTAIIEYVADNVKYTYNPTHYDALSTLRSGSGNCTNAANLSLALLRASGIPARIVGGTTLDKQWKIPIDDSRNLVQSMGQGGHAWVEVYFPDLGWLSYDPRQSKQFTSTRHVKEAHGSDHTDIVDTWVGSPYAPACSNTIEANFVDDEIRLRQRYSQKSPRAYLVSNLMVTGASLAEARPEPPPSVLAPPLPEREIAKEPQPPPPPEPPVTREPEPRIAEVPQPPRPPEPPPKAEEPPPPEPPKVPEKPGPVKPKAVLLGNMEFPTLVDTYRIAGKTGMRLLDTETAEYVTSHYVYAQAFRVGETVSVKDVSLAMHKFGGDGSIYIDLVPDDRGKPAFKDGYRSGLVSLADLPRRQGYGWVVFALADGVRPVTLARGKYWIVLRHSGEAVVTWFYTPGKPYGGPDDARSTLKGYLWEDILAYDFVFRVRGVNLAAP